MPPLLLSSLLPFIHFSLVHGDLPGPGAIASPLQGLPQKTVVPPNETKALLPSTSPLQKLLSQENLRHEAPGAVFVLMLVPDKVWSSAVECCTQCSSTFSDSATLCGLTLHGSRAVAFKHFFLLS